MFGQVQGIDQVGCCDDCGVVLVVVEDGNVYQFVKVLFDDEIVWCFDVFQIDIVEGWVYVMYGIDEFVDVLGIEFQIDGIYIGEVFEQDGFVFYYWFGGQGVEIIEFQNGRFVGDNGYQIVFGCVVVGVVWIFCDGLNWYCYFG